jgi:hypothetical protein
MRNEDHMYHRIRERHCREMAELALNPDVRRRHDELANLHASRAAVNGASAVRPTFSAT